MENYENQVSNKLKWHGTIVMSKDSVNSWVNVFIKRKNLDASKKECERDFLTEEEFNELMDDPEVTSFTYKNYQAQISPEGREQSVPCEYFNSKYRAAVRGFEKANLIPTNVCGVPPYELQVECTYGDEKVAWKDLWKVLGTVPAMKVREQICRSILENGSTQGEIFVG